MARIASACGRLGGPRSRRPAVPRAAPHDQPGGPGRRRQPAAARRGDARPSRRALPRRALRVPPRRARGAAGAAGDGLGLDRARRAPGSGCPAASCSSRRRTRAPAGAGEADAECSCAPLAIQRYQGAAERSARRPDRHPRRDPPAQRRGDRRRARGSPPAAVRERVVAAASRQDDRLGPGRCNAEMTPAEARECALGEGAAALLADAYSRRRLSGRAHDRVLRLAQTIADLAGGEADRARADGPGAAAAAAGTTE